MSAAYFVTLPARVFFDKRLTLPQLRILGIIASHQTAKDGWAMFDQAALAAEYDSEKPISQQAISKHIHALLCYGYIRTRANRNASGQRASNSYAIIADSAVEQEDRITRKETAHKEHKPTCICPTCHPELWEWPINGDKPGCGCKKCTAWRFARTSPKG